MATGLEDLLKEKAAKGQLNHLSLTAHGNRDGSLTFRASYRDTKRDGARHAEHADPVVAITTALTARA